MNIQNKLMLHTLEELNIRYATESACHTLEQLLINITNIEEIDKLYRHISKTKETTIGDIAVIVNSFKVEGIDATLINLSRVGFTKDESVIIIKILSNTL